MEKCDRVVCLLIKRVLAGFILLIFGSVIGHAQYDVDHDGVDELIVLRIRPDSDIFDWEAVNLN